MRSSRGAVTVALLASAAALAAAGSAVAQTYEGYFLFNGAYPEEEGTPYADEFQGLTHDDNNWFLSSNAHASGNKVPQLWKVPVQYNLRHVTEDTGQYPGVIVTRIGTTPLQALGYNHFGDISYYSYGGVGYVLVAVEDETRPYDKPNVVAFFRGSDLAYVNRANMPNFGACKDATALSLGWVAVDPDGYIYTSGDCTTVIYRFAVDWSQVASGTPLTLTNPITNNLLDENGASLELGRTQGGVISPSGKLLYMICGTEDNNYAVASDGINVFDTTSWRRVRKSENGSMPFNYDYDPGWVNGAYVGEEPEGITIWDLDDGRAPGIRGQLHVGMLDNEILSADDVYIYHYLNTIYVDLAYQGEETGEPQKPFNTVGEANDLAWDGARIKIKAGSYPEVVTISKRVEVLADGGNVLVGTTGQALLATEAAGDARKEGEPKPH